MTGSLLLRITSDPGQLTTARSFAGAIGRVLGMDEGQRQDLRLAVSELLTVVLTSESGRASGPPPDSSGRASGPPPDSSGRASAGSMQLSIVVEFHRDEPVLRVEMEGSPPSLPPETSNLLTAMFDDAIWSAAQPWQIRLTIPGDS